MQPKDIDFDRLYQMIYSVPEYMNITGIDFEPTMRIHIVSDLNIIQSAEFEYSNRELQNIIKFVDGLHNANCEKLTNGKQPK